MTKGKTKVVIAMSGGVDSSVAAALLVEQGYEVIGMMLRLWNEPGREAENRCCTPDAMSIAKKVAAILNIPFYVIDARSLFKEKVVDYFIDGYAQGITPNPCLLCNKHIRWGYLFDRAIMAEADFLATGHYARLKFQNSKSMRLYRAFDKSKDQSYVLGILSQKQLRKTLFPIGGYTKNKIRSLAKNYNLPVATTKDSQDLCFLAGTDYRSFIKRHSNGMQRRGNIVDTKGELLGEHEGLALYTIGQRKGIRISSPEPFYVIDKDISTNTLIVGRYEEMGQDQLTASQVNWISGNPPSKSFKAKVKIRYQSPMVSGKVSPIGSRRFQVKFLNSLRDITPGQAAVIYKGEEVIASGIIDTPYSQIDNNTAE